MKQGVNKCKGMWRMDNQLTTELKERYGIVFHDVNLLEQAFTHSSYVNEHRYLKLSDNERLEFLGDAVLELIVSQYLYLKFPELPEGKLTKMRAAIVREDSLAKFAKECHFDNYILLGKGEEASGGRTRASLLCDLFEAFLNLLKTLLFRKLMTVLFHMRWITKHNYKKFYNAKAMFQLNIA